MEKDGGEWGRRLLQLCIAITATAGMQLSDPHSMDEAGEDTRVLDMMLNMTEVILKEIRNVKEIKPAVEGQR